MANTLKTPKVMPSEFCADGDKNTILTSPSTSNPQLANFSTGFPAITQTPIPNGGIPPERADFNGMFNLLSSALVYIQNGGQWTFVPEVSNAIGGYPAGAILNYYDATNKVNKRVISNINNNVNNFLLDPSQIGDSSKPWSYTENTPIVQDLKNPSADTVPSTKAVKDESSRITTLMDNLLSTLYPVGSIYIGTQNNCPLATLIAGSQWQRVATQVVTNVNTGVAVYGNGKILGLTDGQIKGGLFNRVGYGYNAVDANLFNKNLGQSGSGAQSIGVNKGIGVINDAATSGLTGSLSRTNLSLNIWKRTA